MTELEKAARQALEALGHASWDEEWQELAASETSRALRQALEQQPADEPVARVAGYHSGLPVIEPLNPRMVMPVNMSLYTRPQPAAQITDEQIQDLLKIGNPTEEECRLIRLGYAAAQPAAQWVGLDDSDMEEQSKRHLGPHRRSAFRDGWRSAEAKLREKNGGKV